MFAFTKKQALSVETAIAAKWSTDAYDKEDLSASMPSLILELIPQDDKSAEFVFTFLACFLGETPQEAVVKPSW